MSPIAEAVKLSIFPFFILLKILLGNEVGTWRHTSISEGQKRCRGEGRDLKMKAEGEASHYNWTRLIGHCCQKSGGGIFTFLSFLTFHCWQNKSHPSLAAALIWWTGSALCPRRKQFTFLWFWASQLSESWTSCIHKARNMATEPGARHDNPSWEEQMIRLGQPQQENPS